MNAQKLEKAVEDYFARLHLLRSTGGTTGETSYYSVLEGLLNAIGADLRPSVFSVSQMADQGAGHPDFGLYTATQCQKGKPKEGQVPERGVIEVKGTADDAWFTADTEQVTKYWDKYRAVLVTNYRDFLLVGEDRHGLAVKLEGYRLANTEAEFWSRVLTPRRFAREVAQGFGEYLRRVLTHTVSLRDPRDVAWFLASYARDALGRVEDVGEIPALAAVRTALEDALGVQFKGERGDHFFHSTLVQTLFYGVFSAWVLWARQTPSPTGKFDWHTAVWHLRVPMLQALFQQVSDPTKLMALGLVEVLDWASAALNRVDRNEFFDRFDDAEAVQYFYEPFLEAFDPELRKQLGVWYTPSEVVRYMVARVDKALRDDLGVADGLAGENVYILDPCTGTGSFLAEVLRRIADNLEDKGLGGLKGAAMRKAATTRVFGFEIMPAPFVVAHLQVGLALGALGAPLAEDGSERPGIYLTNALTGWEPTEAEKQIVAFPQMEEERDHANEVKREKPILVILGNPPYNGYAGMGIEPERALSEAYRTTKGALRRPEGQGLNDLYVRFFRMAERRIAEKTGEGIVCFISNYSWLDGLSFPGMRQRFLEAFDAIRIDRLNGDKYRTGKTTPNGGPDPSIFSTDRNREGIQVGTAIATLVRKNEHAPSVTVQFRNLWGPDKRQQLLSTAEAEHSGLYNEIVPRIELGLPFAEAEVAPAYFDWPALPELLPTSFPGVKTSRDDFLVDIDLDRLKARVQCYFNSDVPNSELRLRYPNIIKKSTRFEGVLVREKLTKRGILLDNFVRYTYRPFDIRWLYWEPDEKLLDEKRADYWAAFQRETVQFVIPKAQRKTFSPPFIASQLGDLNSMDGGASFMPLELRSAHGEAGGGATDLNLTESSRLLLQKMSLDPSTIMLHALAILHSGEYRSENKSAMRIM